MSHHPCPPHDGCAICSHFGCCPECNDCANTKYLHIGRGHWFYCERHRVCWFAGANLIGGWRDETEDQQRARYDALELDTYREVEPAVCPPTGSMSMVVRLPDSSRTGCPVTERAA